MRQHATKPHSACLHFRLDAQGRQHSEETRRLIGERTKLAMRRKKAEKLAAIGLTLEQWEVCEQIGSTVV